MKLGKWNWPKLFKHLKCIKDFKVNVYSESHKNLRKVVRKAESEGKVSVRRIGKYYFVKLKGFNNENE